jgi:aspartate kinase
MKSHVGVASRMFTALGSAGIPIHNITTSEIKISCILAREHAQRALAIAHEAFGLDRLGAGQVATGSVGAGGIPATSSAVGA